MRPQFPHPRDILTATALLTRLPVRARFDRTAEAAWAWPLVGLIVGTLAGMVAWLAMWADLGPLLAAGLVLATQIVATGAMHEDGLADTADGFWGGWDPVRRLEIMRDSHIGTYGVLALILEMGLRWGALAALLAHPPIWGPLLVAGSGSRLAMLGVAFALPHARADGLSVRTGRPGCGTLLTGLIVCLPILLLTKVGIGVTIVAVTVSVGCAVLARAKINGQTGDVLGATQQVSETAILLTLAAQI